MNLILHGAALDADQLRKAQALLAGPVPQPHGRLIGGRPHAWRFEFDAIAPAQRAAIDTWCQQHQVDAAWFDGEVPALGDYALLAMDMDSTLVTIETIDEVADFCGRKAQVAAITEAAMRGEITDYSESLRRRVALLAGLDATALARVYEERMKLSPGAETLVAAAQAAGLKTLLVSGGFTFFTDRLRQRLNLDFARSNTLGMRDDALDGTVVGEIVDADVKARTVAQVCEQLGVPTSRAIVMGDGANDLKMMKLAGLSVAFRAKPVVRAQASLAFDHCGLDGLLDILR
jgi:phosphoserine phosphatase